MSTVENGGITEGYLRDLKKIKENSNQFLGFNNTGSLQTEIINEIKDNFLNKISDIPLHRQSSNESRISVSLELAEQIISEISLESLSAPKIMVTELYSLVLADGTVSEIEEAIISKICELFKIEEFIKEELLTAAEELNAQVVKTLALILE